MRRLICTMLISVLTTAGLAQHTVRIQVNEFKKRDPIFLTGTMNQWQPGHPDYQLKRINYFRSEIVLRNLPPGTYAFKFTRGTFENVESTAAGRDIPNRLLNIKSDTTLLLQIDGWKDDSTNPGWFSDSAKLARTLEKGFRYLSTNPDSSFKYALESFTLSRKVNDPQMKAYAANLQGEVLLKLGNIEKALELFQEGIRIRKAMSAPHDSGAFSFLYNEIGNAYWLQHDTTNALIHYRLAMGSTPRYAYDHPLHEAICNRLCNMGRVNLAKNQIDSAIWYAARSADVGDRISAITDLFRGDIKLRTHDFAEALRFYRSAVSLGLHHDHDLTVVQQAHQRMSYFFMGDHQIDSAAFYGRRAFATALALQSNAAIKESGSFLAALFRQQGGFDSAFNYQQRVIASNEDELVKQKERLALTTYFNEKITEQALAVDQVEHRSKLWLYGLSATFSLVLLSGFIYRMRMRSDYNKKLKETEMRALRAQMNPHFIFNCLGSINRYIVKSDSRSASQYLTKFAKLIRLILDNSTTDHISLAAESQTLGLYLDMELIRFDNAFQYDIEIDENLQADTTQLPSMLIQPYVENAIWHGLLQKEEKGKLWIRFKKINGYTLHVEIEDNGIGRKRAMELKSKNTLKNKSYGMQISSDRIQIINNLYKLNNSVTIQDLADPQGAPAGTKIVLKIPIA